MGTKAVQGRKVGGRWERGPPIRGKWGKGNATDGGVRASRDCRNGNGGKEGGAAGQMRDRGRGVFLLGSKSSAVREKATTLPARRQNWGVGNTKGGERGTGGRAPAECWLKRHTDVPCGSGERSGGERKEMSLAQQKQETRNVSQGANGETRENKTQTCHERCCRR